jgi:hypothetical protein
MVKDNKTIRINPITIFHQNICGLRKKTDELKKFYVSKLSTYFVSLSKHHLKNFELNEINVDGYNLGATYCRQIVKKRWSLYLCSQQLKLYKY